MYTRELKSRKAKFGWDCGSIHLGTLVEFAKFYTAIHARFPETDFSFEESGWNSNGTVKLYTDKEDVAVWIRNYLC